MKKFRILLSSIVTALIIITPLMNFGFSAEQPLTFKSKSELENYLSTYKEKMDSNILYKLDANPEVRAVSDNISPSSEKSSRTNVQVNGVDEGDLFKNFENHLYYIQNNKVSIVSAKQGKMELVSEIKGHDLNYIDLYVSKNRLVVISNQYSETVRGSETLMQIYDTTNLKSPQLYREVGIEGTFLQSRMTNDNIYIITNKNIPFFRQMEDMMPSKVKDSSNSNFKVIPVTSVCYYPNVTPESYTNILSMNINKLEPMTIESVMGNSKAIYMNLNNLYITSSEYKENYISTLVSKYNIDGSKIKFSKTASIPGTILDQFSMDEYNGNFRIATTTDRWNEKGNDRSSSLFVADQNMNIIGKIENIAPGEKIYSVRFQGNKGYIVTFRQVDPLFTLDLSKANSPKLMGQLKIPGYSTYMHVLPNNMVLGVGRDVQQTYIKDVTGNDVPIGLREGGIKLSLFDVNDPFNPKEKDNMILGGAGSHSEALYNHKALMVNPENGDFGFSASLIDDGKENSSFFGAVLVNTKNGKLSLRGKINPTSFDVYADNSRLAYIGDYLYYITPGKISSYNYSDLKPISNITI